VVNRKEVILKHDKDRPLVAKATLKKLKELKWEALMHPSYSKDLSQPDFHLFEVSATFFVKKEFGSLEPLKNALDSFFDSKPTEFNSNGIYKLAIRWENVMDKDGQYIED